MGSWAIPAPAQTHSVVVAPCLRRTQQPTRCFCPADELVLPTEHFLMKAWLHFEVSSDPIIPHTAVQHKAAAAIDHHQWTVAIHTGAPSSCYSSPTCLEGENLHTSTEVKESSPSAARTLISPPCAVTPLKNSFQKSLLLLVTNTILKGKYPESSDKAKSMCHKEESKNRTLQPKSHAFICNKLRRKMASRPKITNFFLNPLLISNSDCSALLHFITFPVTVSSLGNYHSPPRAMLFPTCQLLPLPPVITTLIPVLQLSAELVRKSGKDDLDIKAADHAEKLLGEKVTPHFLQENFKQVGVF